MELRDFKSILVDEDQSARTQPTLVFYNSSVYDMGNIAAAVRNADGDWQLMTYANVSSSNLYKIKLLAQGILDALEFIQVWMYEQLQKWQPVSVTDSDVLFGASDMDKLVPQRYEIPEDFDHWNRHNHKPNKFVELVNTWFYEGFDDDILIPKPGIDKALAMRHLDCISHSWSIKHERKIEGIAVLMSIWFDINEQPILSTP